MRPLRLSLQAFGPFADTQVIDFREALESRLFGIYGPMGAGKTSILDGLCFALFGESSGRERQGDDLRSHHANAEIETEAQLIFEVGAKRYHLVRRPRQTVRGKRGTLVERQHWAALYDATGLHVDNINVENPGVVIEERRVDAVADALQTILHYSAAQFRQVVLLPQGQFRQLLTATSDQRSAVLRGLFDVSLYERFVERLKAEAGDLREAVTQGRAQIEAHLTAQGVADFQGLAQAIAAASDHVIAQTAARDEAGLARDSLRAALQDAQTLEAQFAEHDLAAAALSALLADEPEIDNLLVRHAAALQAQACAGADAREAAATQALAAATTAHRAAAVEAERLDAAAITAAEALARSTALQSERDAAVARVTGLESYQVRLDAAGPLRAQANTSAKRRSETTTALAAAQSAQAVAATALEQTLANQVHTQQQALRKGALEAAVAAVRNEHDMAVAFGAAAEKARGLADLRAAAQLQLQAFRRALTAARTAEEAAEEALSSAQASHLALALIDGQPCPVCGARAHPQPATPDEGGQDLEQAWRAARATRQDADQVERDAAEAAARIDGEWSQAETRRLELAAPARSPELIAADLARLLAELKEAGDGPEAGDLALWVETARSEAEECTARLDAARDAFAAADKDAAAQAAAFAAALSDVPEDLRDAAALVAAIKVAVTVRDESLDRHAAAAAAERAAAEASTAAVATAAVARQREHDLDLAAQVASEDLQAALAKAGLNAAAYDLAKADLPDLEGFTARIRSFREGVAAATDRRDRALATIEDRIRPAVASATAAVADADEKLAGVEQMLAAAGVRLEQLEAAGEVVAKLDGNLAAATERYRALGELSALADGRNAHRLRLRDFAIAATFDLVLDAANLRFARMSRGRFTLQRKFEGGDGRARAGLDIEVYDAHTDQKRDAHTLSGGEGFLASLSLALGLSDVVQAESGGVKLDAIFIDEGFGHLDDETLDIALETLRDLVGQNRAVGVISHVDGVKQQISAGFDVVRTLRGSRIEPRCAA